jgi:hypothetical protein
MIKSIEELERLIKFAANTKKLASLRVGTDGEVVMNFDTSPDFGDVPGVIKGLPREGGQLLDTSNRTSIDFDKADWYEDGNDPGAAAEEAYRRANGAADSTQPEYESSVEPPEDD